MLPGFPKCDLVSQNVTLFPEIVTQLKKTGSISKEPGHNFGKPGSHFQVISGLKFHILLTWLEYAIELSIVKQIQKFNSK